MGWGMGRTGGRIDPAQKEQLVAAGQWEAFLARRDELKAQGRAPSDARVAAFKDVMHGRDEEGEGQGDATEGDALQTAPCGLDQLAQADEPTVIRWVARNIDNPDPDPKTAPDPFAWTLLRTCRENPAFLTECFLPLWAKLIPPRSQLEAAGPREFDGRPTLDLLARIEAMRDEAMRDEAPTPHLASLADEHEAVGDE